MLLPKERQSSPSHSRDAHQPGSGVGKDSPTLSGRRSGNEFTEPSEAGADQRCRAIGPRDWILSKAQAVGQVELRLPGLGEMRAHPAGSTTLCRRRDAGDARPILPSTFYRWLDRHQEGGA